MSTLKLKEVDLTLGKNSGKSLYLDLKNAKDSILIISPYFSPYYIDVLTTKVGDGVGVSFITSTDFEENRDFYESYRKIIYQTAVVDEKRKKGRKTAQLVLLSITLLLLFKLFSGAFSFVLLLGAIASGYFTFLVGKLSVVSYKYSTALNFLAVSGREDFLHTKLYIIDHRVAYMGSLNLTHSGFQHNHETCIKIEDEKAIHSLANEFQKIYQEYSHRAVPLEYIGKKVYEEKHL